MLAQQELERTMAVTIEAERQAVINELAQFEASACEIATTLERVIKHPLRSAREAIEPARSAGLAVKRSPFLAVGVATLASISDHPREN